MAKRKSSTQLEREAKAKARGHAAGEYHFGRINTIRDEHDKFYSYRTGPVPEPSGKGYRGARGATLDHVLKMLRKLTSEEVTVAVYGRMYPGRKDFQWIADTRNREELIDGIEAHIETGSTVEEAVFALFSLDKMPDLVLAWEVRPHG